ncbi:SDR family NAD(P)-dependent oxidoreductase [Zhouia sp. PK063]|uniref:SDR family NAD(P)-dependent oxidoreductase n=1 Tax=Zhouia sp. PK063 TaxID=3373602 RepID=UPI003792B6D5
MSFSLKNKNAIITGGASGIGKAIAAKFAFSGAKVYILEYNQEHAAATVKEIEQQGGLAESYFVNVANFQHVQEVVEAIGSTQPIDILVNNAGIAHVGNVEQTTEADFDKIYQVNVKGVYNCLHACIPYLKKSKGVILNMASIASEVGISDRFAYSMSKGAVLTMTYSIAKDYLKDNIRCNAISPARIHTPFVDGFIAKNYPDNQKEMFEKLSKTQPIGRMGTPDEVAQLALYLCSDAAGFVTGSNFPLDGGFIKLNG